MAEPDDFEGIGVASWQADGGPEIKFPLVARDKQSSNRLPERERPYQDGSKSDHTGRKADQFTVEALFHNTATMFEADLGDSPTLWPDRCNLLDTQLGSRKCGTLNLPWERNIRCRATSWTRRANAEDLRGGERMSISFRRDNEENLDAGAVEETSVRTVVLRATRELVFEAERIGMSDVVLDTVFDLDEAEPGAGIEGITAFAAEVEGTLAAPGEFLGDLAHQANRLVRACDSIIESFSSRSPGRNKTDDPDSAIAVQRLRELKELGARALGEASASQPPTVARRFPTDRDLYSIAAELNQNAEALIEVNPQIEDPSSVPAGRVVFVFVE